MDKIIIAVFLGVVAGLVNAILFIRTDKTWKKWFSAGGGGSASIAIFFAVIEQLGIDTSSRVNLFAFYLGSFAVTLFLGIPALVYLTLHKQTGRYQLRAADIILGREDAIGDYYKSRKQEVDADLNIAGLTKKEDALETRAEELDARQRKIVSEEATQHEQRNQIDLAVRNGVHITLPVSSPVPVDQHFISLFPEYCHRLANHLKNVNSLTVQFLRKARRLGKTMATPGPPATHRRSRAGKDKRPSAQDVSTEDLLKGYFYGLSVYICTDLFGAAPGDIRVHFRYLNNGLYHCLWSYIADKTDARHVSVIPADEGMIYHAGKEKRSLVKHLNMSLHHAAAHDQIWQDYMTLVFDHFYEREAPLISMGISVKHPESTRALFHFLCFIRYEQLLQSAMADFDKELPFREVISRVREQQTQSSLSIH